MPKLLASVFFGLNVGFAIYGAMTGNNIIAAGNGGVAAFMLISTLTTH